MARFIKRIFIIVSVVLILSSNVLTLSSCTLILPKVSEKLPDEEIVKVEKVTEFPSDNIVYQELPQEKVAQFKKYLQELHYKKWINWRGLLLAYYDEERFLITYENFTVQIGEKRFIVRTLDENEIQEQFTIDVLYPEDTLSKMFALFED